MKNLKISNKSKLTFLKFWKGWNLLDGQRRGEIVFRRVFVLIVGSALIYLLLLAIVGKKDQNVEEVKAVETIQEVVNEEKEEWVDGDKVTTKPDGIVEVVPAEVFMESSVTAIKRFTQSYRGSRIDDKYFTLLDQYCSDEALRTVVAISVAESGMGRDVKRQSNFYGWFKGGDRNYDPSQEVMAKEICNGVEKYYLNIGTDSAKSRRYVGHDTTNWLRNYRWAYAQMEVK
jgi:hypothetical protein